jgi:hypothetical protein
MRRRTYRALRPTAVQGQATAWQGKIVDGAGSATAMVATSLEKLDPSTSRSAPALEPSEGEQDERYDERTDRVLHGDMSGARLEPREKRGKEKCGETEPEDLSDNLIVQLGVATEALNRAWYQRNMGRVVTDVQRWVQHPVHRFLAATLDGFVNDLDAVFEAKFMLPWSFSEEAAAEKHMAQLQHNMWVTNARSAALSIITGCGKWVEMTIPADALYQHFLVTAERRFWRVSKRARHLGPTG